MSSSPIRVALVGYGLGGAVFHAPLIEATPELLLVSIVTRDPERVARARERHPHASVLPDVEAVRSATDGHDLVVVATPNRFHVPIALAALEAGLHVVVDKPFTSTAAEGERLASVAAARGLLLTVLQNRRLDGDFLTLQRLIAEGELGRVLRFESRFERWNPEVKAGAWRERGEPEEAGGVLFDLGSHLVDQAVRLFGPPVRVYAEVERRRPGAQVDDDAFVALEHADGVRSHLWMSLVCRSLGPRFRVLGLGGAFQKHGLDVQEAQLAAGLAPTDPEYGLEPEERWGLLTRDGDGEPVPVATERGAYPRFYQGVADSILRRAPAPVSAQDAIGTIAILEAARLSAASGVTRSV